MRHPGSTGRLVPAIVAVVVGIGAAAPARVDAATGGCSAAQLIVARGTGEPGRLGVVIGDPLLSLLRARRPGMSAYRVNYPASLDRGSPAAGDRDLVVHVRSQAAKCPRQRFVLAGYSQGANVVEMALGEDTSRAVVGGPSVARIPARLTSRVAAILLFGNPLAKSDGSVPGAYRGRTLDTCNPGDIICDPSGSEIIKHVLYGPYLERAAAFAAKRIS